MCRWGLLRLWAEEGAFGVSIPVCALVRGCIKANQGVVVGQRVRRWKSPPQERTNGGKGRQTANAWLCMCGARGSLFFVPATTSFISLVFHFWGVGGQAWGSWHSGVQGGAEVGDEGC